MSTQITHVGTVIIPVADQDAALAHYQRLGFETRIDGAFGEGMRWIEVAPPGAQTTLALVPQTFTFRDADGNPFRMVQRD